MVDCEHSDELANRTRFAKRSQLTIYLIIILCVTALCIVGIQLITLARLGKLEYQLIETFRNNTISTQDADRMDKLQLPDNATVNNENYFKIINRTEWGAIPSNGQLRRLKQPIRMVIVGHTDTQQCNDFVTCKFQLNLLQLFYIQLRNFEDIGYNFLIGGDGAVYEGIGWDNIGFHTKDHNDYSVGIGFIGNYQKNSPTENQLSAAYLLLNDGLQNNYLDKNYIVKGQRDFLPIISPGDNIYDRMKNWDHYE